VGFAQGGPAYFNRYGYTANDPINFYDPNGMCTGSRITNDDGTCASNGSYTTQDSVLGELQRENVTALILSDSNGSTDLSSFRDEEGRGARRSVRRNTPRLGHGGIQSQTRNFGHTARRHIGRSNAQLRARLDSNPNLRRSSTFTNFHMARRALDGAFVNSLNREAFNNWAANGFVGRLTVHYYGNHPIGRVLERGQSTPRRASHATFVLEGNPNNPGGFGVVTAYPF